MDTASQIPQRAEAVEPMVVRVQGDLPLIELVEALARGGLRLRNDPRAGGVVLERIAEAA